MVSKVLAILHLPVNWPLFQLEFESEVVDSADPQQKSLVQVAECGLIFVLAKQCLFFVVP
jgi:hypothetical protein